jgi:hypothetical protein
MTSHRINLHRGNLSNRLERRVWSKGPFLRAVQLGLEKGSPRHDLPFCKLGIPQRQTGEIHILLVDISRRRHFRTCRGQLSLENEVGVGFNLAVRICLTASVREWSFPTWRLGTFWNHNTSLKGIGLIRRRRRWSGRRGEMVELVWRWGREADICRKLVLT